ncbi:Uncharacterized protein FWK35_00016472 [Aphis craccivora]|uniref:Uncharacterized protein n=1 Tax=Aphis craccivora TaxID=307492 RepID=A0A6G0Z666_APHCR|nr:Uncharacterized protein FWK35_00016472 [Aphis craccivora]
MPYLGGSLIKVLYRIVTTKMNYKLKLKNFCPSKFYIERYINEGKLLNYIFGLLFLEPDEVEDTFVYHFLPLVVKKNFKLICKKYFFLCRFQVDEYIKIRSAEEGMIHNKKVKQ